MAELKQNKNKEFGKALAEEMWREGLTKCPLVLGSEQAKALHKRWKELIKTRHQR